MGKTNFKVIFLRSINWNTSIEGMNHHTDTQIQVFTDENERGCGVQNRNFLKIGITSTFFKIIRMSFNLHSRNIVMSFKFFSVTFVLLPIFFFKICKLSLIWVKFILKSSYQKPQFTKLNQTWLEWNLGLCLVLIAIHLKILRFDFVPIL